MKKATLIFASIALCLGLVGCGSNVKISSAENEGECNVIKSNVEQLMTVCKVDINENQWVLCVTTPGDALTCDWDHIVKRY